MICVPISKVLLKGMSNHPHFEIFWTSSKIWRIRIFFSKFKISSEKKLLLVSSIGYLSIKILTKKKFQNSKIFTSKMGRVWNEKKIKTLSAHHFLKVELVPQFRKFLNVWHIQNLEQPFLIWACNCLVKFWRSPKNFKIQNLLGGILLW